MCAFIDQGGDRLAKNTAVGRNCIAGLVEARDEKSLDDLCG